jgi:hypothetical protein
MIWKWHIYSSHTHLLPDCLNHNPILTKQQETNQMSNVQLINSTHRRECPKSNVTHKEILVFSFGRA